MALDLVGATQSEINNAYVVTATRIQVSGDRPVTVKYGPQGAIGSAKGAEKVTGSITLAVPKLGLELDILGALELPGGFTFSFPIGLERHALYGCYRTKRAFSNNPEAGDTEFSFDFTGAIWVRTR